MHMLGKDVVQLLTEHGLMPVDLSLQVLFAYVCVYVCRPLSVCVSTPIRLFIDPSPCVSTPLSSTVCLSIPLSSTACTHAHIHVPQPLSPPVCRPLSLDRICMCVCIYVLIPLSRSYTYVHIYTGAYKRVCMCTYAYVYESDFDAPSCTCCFACTPLHAHLDS